MRFLARKVEDGIEVCPASEVEDATGWIEVIEKRPSLQEGQHHIGPVYKMGPGDQVVFAEYEVENDDPPSPLAVIREEVAQARTLASLREAVLRLIDNFERLA